VWRIERTIPGVDASRDELLPFVGPAISLPLWSLLARLPFELARNIWLEVLVLALAVLVLASLRIAGRPYSWMECASALLLGAVAAPAVSDISLGQAALVSAAAVAFAFVALERGSPWAVAAACVAAIQPNLALPLAASLTRRRNVLMLASALVLFLAITLGVGGGPAGLLSYLQRLATHAAGERFIAIQYSVPAILAAFGVASNASVLAGDVIGVLALAVAAFAAYRFRARPAFAAAIAVALLPWIVPFFHEHDFAIVLLPAIVVAAATSPRVRALGGIAAVCVFVDWFGIAQRPAAVLQIACLAGAVACAYLVLADRDKRPAWPLAPLAACVVLLACTVPFALAHPAPTWPDQLGAFHAPATLDASAVWAAEQERSGLAATVPAWGLLRAVPLAGCVLFAYASFAAGRAER
jgi:Glycosyltransferase family 87